MAAASATACPVCDGARSYAFSQRLLGKHDVDYFSCDACGLLQTETPHWLDEAYARAIADLDTGLLARNQAVARRIAALLHLWFEPRARFLDMAGGYGILTRLMRDAGFHFYWDDPYCENLFARGFEAAPAESFAAVTAIEVLEHVQDPYEFLARALGRSRDGVVIVTTELFSGSPPARGWWYYTPGTGQHVSFYQLRTLHALAGRLKCRLLSYGTLHVFTRTPRSRLLAAAATGRLGRMSFDVVRRRRSSLTFADHLTLGERLSAPGTAES